MLIFCQAMKLNYLPAKKKKVHITPAQQMLNRFEALQSAASSGSSGAAVKRSSSVDTGVAMKQTASHEFGNVSNVAATGDSSKVPCATKPKVGGRVAHKPVMVRLLHVSQFCY